MTTRSIAQESVTFVIGGDLTVNRLGFGAMRITGKGVWGPPADADECIRVLRRAVELGVNFIDTADSYGPYVSEELIRTALQPYADEVVIAPTRSSSLPRRACYVPGPTSGSRSDSRHICVRNAK